MKIQDRKSRWYLGFELIFLILFVFTKYELFIKNTYYLSSLRLAGDSVGYFFLTVLLFSGFVKLVSKLSLANIAAGIVLFYFSVAMFANGQDEFYFSVSSVRFSLVPFVIMLFFIFRHRPLTMLSMGFIGHCSFILLAMSLKVFLTWTNFVLPNSTVVGCQVLPKQDLKWTPPGWTLPLYSVLKQYSLQPKSVWVLANSPEEKTCIRFGDYLVLDKDYQYHLMGFHWRIDGSLLLQNVPQAEFPIPYSDLKKQIILPRSGLIKFNGQNLIIPPGSCLNIDILHLSETDSNVIINIDGKEKYRETIRADITLSLPIDVNFNEVEIKVKTKFAYSMNVRSVTAASCL